MKPRFAPAYLDDLFTRGDYDALVELSALLIGSDRYDPAKQDYGMETPLFVYLESLLWFAQAVRSGAGTYFEAVSTERQHAMFAALQAHAPSDFALMYEQGAVACRQHGSLEMLDSWMQQNDSRNSGWLADLARSHRPQFKGAILGT